MHPAAESFTYSNPNRDDEAFRHVSPDLRLVGLF